MYVLLQHFQLNSKSILKTNKSLFIARWVLLVVLLKLVACQKDYDTDDFQFTTNDQQITVTYNPGQDCLPYDGSVVPDCSKYIDPVTKEPYYKEHSNSKYENEYWEMNSILAMDKSLTSKNAQLDSVSRTKYNWH